MSYNPTIMDESINQITVESVKESEPLIKKKKKIEVPQRRFPKWMFLAEWIANFYYSDSIIGAVFSYSNATVGAGVLFLPYVISEMGVILGFAFIAFGGFLCSVTMYILYKTYEKLAETKPELLDYEEIGEYCFGKWMSYFVQACIIILNFGCAMTYSVVLADLLHGWIENKYFHALALAGVMTPFVIISMSKQIASLRISGYLTVFSIMTFIVLVIVSYFLGITNDLKIGELKLYPELTNYKSYLNILSIVGIVTFSFACHSNLCPIVSQFKPENRYKSGVAIFFNVELIFFIYSFIAEFGYLSFLDNTNSDIIKSYSGNHWIFSILRVLTACAVCATYPMASYPTRYTVNNAIFDTMEWMMKKGKSKGDDDDKKEKFRESKTGKALDLFLNIFVSSMIGIISYLIAIFWGKASEIFSVIGSSASTCCAYIFPCLFFFKICKPKKWYLKLVVVIILIYGTVFGVVSTVISTLKIIFPKVFSYD